ncbi:MAG: CHASE2 domain-containing protein, partial [Sphingomonadales bacterium]
MRLVSSAAFLILAVIFARFGWSIPLAGDAERMLYDVRAFLTSPRVDQDPRITMVVYTDETLAATGKRSPLDRAMLAKALATLDDMGAKAIGIDILIDQAQPEDPKLIESFRRMRTPTYLAFASNATNANYIRTWQEDFIRQFVAQLKPGNVHPTSIRIEPDPDGVTRNWPVQPRSLPPLMANSLAPGHDAFRDYTAGIRFRLPLHADRPVFNSLPIDLFAVPGMAKVLRSQIQGRYVLIGGDISDIDQFEVPSTRYDKDKKTT